MSNKSKELFDSQKTLFQQLNQLYENWKIKTNTLPTFLTLPNLPTLPKDIPQEKSFLIRDITVEIFHNFEYIDKFERQSGQYGTYLAGPNGIGKSVIMYCAACLAYARNWLVFYVPRCDEWVSRVGEDQQCLYLLEVFYRYIYQL